MRIDQRQDEGQIFVDQEKYIKKILKKKFNMINSSSSSIPMDPNVKLSKGGPEEERKEMEPIPYQEVIGSLLYQLRFHVLTSIMLLMHVIGTTIIQGCHIGMQ